MLKALGQKPIQVLSSRDYLVVFQSEEIVRDIQPDMTLLSKLDKFGVIITARGKVADFVSRFFVPGEGIPEDPVTGSSHCTLIPYWSNILSKSSLTAFQISKRTVYTNEARIRKLNHKQPNKSHLKLLVNEKVFFTLEPALCL